MTLSRSYLFAPGDNAKLLGKVFDAGADAVVLDLEDAVALHRKAEARQMVAATLQSRIGRLRPRVYVRINAVTTNFWREDIQSIVHPTVHGIRLAKAESAEQLQLVSSALDEAEQRAGVAVGSIRLVPTIESAVGLFAAPEMAQHSRVAAFSFGAADFCHDIGAEADEMETQTFVARSQLVLLSRAAGLQPPIASVHTRLKDLDGLRATTEAARRMGFFGRSCIHPSQLAVIHEVFTPSAEQLAAARATVAAFDAAMREGTAAVALADGQFVDRPIVERARAVVALAEALGKQESHG
jgi:citrate lyase subunit beta/citryl-CoA lyase